MMKEGIKEERDRNRKIGKVTASGRSTGKGQLGGLKEQVIISKLPWEVLSEERREGEEENMAGWIVLLQQKHEGLPGVSP